ncbi:MAG: MoxR family ATPase [Bacteroidota bacterium]
MSLNIYKKTKTKDETLPVIPINPNINDPKLYIPSDALVSAVNVALVLNQPLLVTGEPGTGKTRLADHIAYFFDLGKPIVFNAQTTSSVKELFYRYDAISHFQYSQTNKQVLSPDEIEDQYISYEGIGKAIKEKRRALVLIDEIDKAPRDLPNDILAALEDLKFKVPEIGKTYEAANDQRPVIILTSNSEKNLPDAFLRRVAYHHIPFPDSKQLLEILQSKVSDYSTTNLEAVIQHFEGIRKGRKTKLRKNPATAELIYWTLLLQKMGFDSSKLQNTADLNSDERQQLMSSYAVLAKNKEDLASLRKAL